MSADDNGRPNSLCPSREELTAFSCGRLPVQRLETIADHLEVCPPCASTLHGVSIPDTLVNQLGQHSSSLPHQEETACSQLEQRACAIAAQQTALPTVSDKQADAHQPGPPLPAGFGGFVLLEQIGHGGMGIVYKARQESLKRLVAVKLVRAGIYASATERARFQREGEAIARIHHPNVVQIHEFGEHQGQLYFSMELLPGGTLAQRLGGRPLPQREAAELVRILAQTVEAAHRQGVVHRDLKPSNVMFTADGTVKITDFGLAKMLDDESSDTCTDAILGTPAYMAPEQASGESNKIGPATDVYALGSLLYETLTGRPPFRAETRQQTLELVRTKKPTPPSQLHKDLSPYLEAICLKCLQKEPALRYAGARELVEDLERYLRGEKPPSVRVPWHDRRKLVLGACAGGLLALTLFGAIFWPRWQPQAVLPPTIVLIDENTAPKEFHWVFGEKDSEVTAIPPNGIFTIRSKKTGYLELYPPPPWPSYRLEAEIQDEEGSKAYRGVGIFLALRRWQTERGPYFSALGLYFDEHGTARGKAYLQAQHLEGFPPYQEREATPHNFDPQLFDVALQPPMPRRQLAVEVRGNAVSAFWGEKRFGTLSGEQIETLFARSAFANVKGEATNWFDPQAGIGILIGEGTARIHRLELKPLP